VNLAALANSPQGAQLRQMVQENPQMLQPLLQQLVASDPQLAAAIQANPELLFQLLGGGGEGDDGEGMEGVEGENDALPPGTHVVQLTPAERDAVERVRVFRLYTRSTVDVECSCRRWGSRSRRACRRTSRVTRTRSWQRTSCSRADSKTTTEEGHLKDRVAYLSTLFLFGFPGCCRAVVRTASRSVAGGLGPQKGNWL
jgi:hypothetical protein